MKYDDPKSPQRQDEEAIGGSMPNPESEDQLPEDSENPKEIDTSPEATEVKDQPQPDGEDPDPTSD